MMYVYLGRAIHESLMNAIQAGHDDISARLVQLLCAYVRLFGPLV